MHKLKIEKLSLQEQQQKAEDNVSATASIRRQEINYE